MNRRQLEVQKETAKNEKDILSKIQRNYTEALEDIGDKIKELQSTTLTQSKIYQIEYQKALKKQVSSILESIKKNNFITVAAYMQTCYEDGFIGTLYDLQGQGIPLAFPIEQDQVAKVCSYSPGDIKLSKRLYDKVEEFGNNVIGEIGRGISNAYSYEQIAKNLTFYGAASIGRTMTIARTEGHRVQQSATFDCQVKAKEKGAEVVKQWDSTLDGLTRPHHKDLDGQIREVEAPFEVAGKSAMYPGAFGEAAEDCNCRCCSLQRAKWALTDEEYTKMNGDTNELVRLKEKDYNRFKESYKKEIEISFKDKRVIQEYMGAKSYIVNEKLRNGVKLSAEEKKFVSQLDKALDKFPNYNGNLRRTLTFYSDDEVTNFMNGYSIDGLVEFSEYLSTTKGDLYNPDGQVQVYIQNASKAKDISSLNEKEQEVLYKRGTKFKVKNAIKQNGVNYILLEELQ